MKIQYSNGVKIDSFNTSSYTYLTPLTVVGSTSDPTGVSGMLNYRSDLGKFRYYNGTIWADLSSVSNVRITNVDNTATGTNALVNGPNTGSDNSAYGWSALAANTSGVNNTAIGSAALNTNTTGNNNTVVGSQSMLTNNGNSNTVVGASSMGSNSTGSGNTVVGQIAMIFNSTGIRNTVVGFDILNSNNGSYNTAVGYNCMVGNTSGGDNIAVGNNALSANTTGSNNVTIGTRAGSSGNLTTASNNTFIGYQAGSTTAISNPTNVTAIGNGANVSASNQVVLGNTSVTSWLAGANTIWHSGNMNLVPVTVTYVTDATAILTDANKFVLMNSASANAYTIPPNSSVAFPLYTEFYIRQHGTGATTIAAGAGVTITKPSAMSLTLVGQYSVLRVKQITTDNWIVF